MTDFYNYLIDKDINPNIRSKTGMYSDISS